MLCNFYYSDLIGHPFCYPLSRQVDLLKNNIDRMSSAKRPRQEDLSSVGASGSLHGPPLNAQPSATHESPFVISSLDTSRIQEDTHTHSQVPVKSPLPIPLGHIIPAGGSEGQQRLSQEDDDDSENPDDDVIMAVEASSKGGIGCCFFLAEERRLLVMSDINGGESTVILEQRR